MELFYQPDFSAENPVLDAEESFHCVKVLRKKAGDIIFITNGKGLIFESEIQEANPKRCQLKVQKKEDQSRPTGYFHLAIAPTKNNDRMEWLVEKCTEIGLQEITFFFSQNSERTKFKIERIRKKAVAAMKQSLSAYMPTINEPVKMKAVYDLPADQKFIAHFHPQNKNLQKEIISTKSCLVMIGPEGDFSKEELKLARENNFKSVNLGKNRLRTETAGLAACHTYALRNQ